MERELSPEEKKELAKKELLKAALEKKRLERKAEEEKEYEKKRLKEKLNKERLKRQEEERLKEEIKEDLNQRRLLKQKREEIEKTRFLNAKIYKIRTHEYYKLHDSYNDYYIKIEDTKKLKTVQKKIELMELYYGNYKKINAMVKLEKKNENVLISLDTIKVQFKAYKVIKEEK